MILVTFLSLCSIAYGNSEPKFEGRIVGGVETTIESFPYQVSVYYSNRHTCGGTIIDIYSVLTAAHCVFNKDYSLFSVRVGNTKHSEGNKFNVSKVLMKSDYDSITTDNDLAILTLESPLTFNKQIQAIPLQPDGVEIPSNTFANVSGWGTEYEGSQGVAILRMTSVAVIHNGLCKSKYESSNVKITNHMMCALTNGKDSCQGDSGGPLVADNKLIGVVSWGIGCARPNYPGVYAKVSNLYSWIVANQYAVYNSGSHPTEFIVILVLAIAMQLIV